MTEVQFFYRIDTLQIDAVYRNVETNSAVFKNSTVYAEVNVSDPPYEVSRNHKVVLDAEGEVTGTEPNVNPLQPKPTPDPNLDIITDLKEKYPTASDADKREMLRKALLRVLGA